MINYSILKKLVQKRVPLNEFTFKTKSEWPSDRFYIADLIENSDIGEYSLNGEKSRVTPSQFFKKNGSVIAKSPYYDISELQGDPRYTSIFEKAGELPILKVAVYHFETFLVFDVLYPDNSKFFIVLAPQELEPNAPFSINGSLEMSVLLNVLNSNGEDLNKFLAIKAASLIEYISKKDTAIGFISNICSFFKR